MKIVLEGTEMELINVLHSFGVPNEVVFDDGSQFICGDVGGRGHRRKKVVSFMSNSDNSEIQALAKEQANRRRRVYEQLHRS